MTDMIDQKTPGFYRLKNELRTIRRNLVRRIWVDLMLVPVVAYYVIFHYWPMYGVTMAFKNFNPM